MNASGEKQLFSSTVTTLAVVLLLLITLLEGLHPRASLAVSQLDADSVPLPAGTFNVQIQALEVTQGVRGDIPTRTAPNDDLVLLPDGAVHVANRRTVVRAYPWVKASSGTTAPPLTARLWAYRDGESLPSSPITPVIPRLEGISPRWTLEEMRSDAAKSWNFFLPQAWVTAASQEESFDLRFVVEANPPGAEHKSECEGCDNDNALILGDQEFVCVPPLTIKPYLVTHIYTNYEGKEVTIPGPTPDEVAAALRNVHRLLPIGDGAWGMLVLPPTRIAWRGLIKADGEHVFAEAMVQSFFPDGLHESTQPNVLHLFLFNPSESTGLAWVHKPYVQASTRGFSLAHELTHAIGLDHAGNGHGEGSFNPDYPDKNGRVEPNAYGFDVWSMQPISPNSSPNGTHDYMSYGPKPKWVSIYTWENVARLLGQPNLQVGENG